MWLFAVILVSGIFGVALQNYIPRRMTELVPHETIYEQIPTVIRGLRARPTSASSSSRPIWAWTRGRPSSCAPAA